MCTRRCYISNFSQVSMKFWSESLISRQKFLNFVSSFPAGEK